MLAHRHRRRARLQPPRMVQTLARGRRTECFHPSQARSPGELDHEQAPTRSHHAGACRRHRGIARR